MPFGHGIKIQFLFGYTSEDGFSTSTCDVPYAGHNSFVLQELISMDPNTRMTTTNAIFFITACLMLLSDEMNVLQCLAFVQIYTKKRYFKKKSFLV